MIYYSPSLNLETQLCTYYTIYLTKSNVFTKIYAFVAYIPPPKGNGFYSLAYKKYIYENLIKFV